MASFAILPSLPNAFCNGCVRLPDFDLLIISLPVKDFLFYHTDPMQLQFEWVNDINSAIVAMESFSNCHKNIGIKVILIKIRLLLSIYSNSKFSVIC